LKDPERTEEMSENNNNDNKDFEEFSKKVNEYTDKTVKTLKDLGSKTITYLDAEKQKAQIRSEIGQNNRELTKAYEKLGRDYYASKVTGNELPSENNTFDLIRSKEKVVELLNDKLKGFD
jgi:lipid II:glycine glycyltransferase (peptidoglycan interpeptide bridge formation enzyme)